MCDNCDDDDTDGKFKQRVLNSQKTHQLLAALKMLETTRFEKWMGSGVMVILTPITPHKNLGGEFMLAAEVFQEIAPLMAASLRESLALRKVLLVSELKSITDVLPPPATTK